MHRGRLDPCEHHQGAAAPYEHRLSLGLEAKQRGRPGWTSKTRVGKNGDEHTPCPSLTDLAPERAGRVSAGL